MEAQVEIRNEESMDRVNYIFIGLHINDEREGAKQPNNFRHFESSLMHIDAYIRNAKKTH